MIIVASKVSSHCGIMIAFNVKDMTLESVYFEKLECNLCEKTSMGDFTQFWYKCHHW